MWKNLNKNRLSKVGLISKRFYSTQGMAGSYIKRTTLFKVPKEEDIDAVLKQYEILRKNAVKVCSTSPSTDFQSPLS